MSVTDAAVAEVKPWIRYGARVGYAAKGIVYIIIGALAAAAAVGSGGETTGSGGALRTIVGKPFGKTLLIVIGIGLLCYLLWRLIEAIKDASGHGSDGKGIAKRLFAAGKGIVYGLLGVQAIRLALGSGGGESDDAKAQSSTATLMNLPFGDVLVGIVGAGVVIYGLWDVYRAAKSELSRDLALEQTSMRDVIIKISRFGIGARGVVFVILGFFLSYAAWRSDPSEARGIGGALDTIGSGSAVLLLLVAVGLIAYGIYELANARFRRLRT